MKKEFLRKELIRCSLDEFGRARHSRGCTSGSTSGWAGIRELCLMSQHRQNREIENLGSTATGNEPASIPAAARAGMRALKFSGCRGGSDGWAAGRGRGQGTQRDTAQKAFVSACACAERGFSLPRCGLCLRGRALSRLPHVPHGARGSRPFGRGMGELGRRR